MKASDGDAPVDRFLRPGCLSYPEFNRAGEAELLRTADPGPASATVHTLAACGRANDLAALVAASPAAVSTDGGPHRWPPLLYLCCSRLRQEDDLGSLTVLRTGADPNAGFLWQGLPQPGGDGRRTPALRRRARIHRARPAAAGVRCGSGHAGIPPDPR
ncbi:hypothetical protein GCM10022222_54470 [Amycolatopsis ultiminotia]|uniref:Ankyrin repeat domain-containing protein n=1 Tax=Amycolatopsis ultiminotia TaxID=543629 RepID=A0ABP6XA97_9PSEU